MWDSWQNHKSDKVPLRYYCFPSRDHRDLGDIRRNSVLVSMILRIGNGVPIHEYHGGRGRVRLRLGSAVGADALAPQPRTGLVPGRWHFAGIGGPTGKRSCLFFTKALN